MNRLFFRIKEKVFRTGPVIGKYALNYSFGIFLLNKIIKFRIFQRHRRSEIENLTKLLNILDVPKSQYKDIINQYLFNNTWNDWKSWYYEQSQTFHKYWQIEGKAKIEELYQNHQVIIFLYRHTALTDQHQSLLRFGLQFKFVTLGNTTSKKFLLRNGQTELPEEITNNPFKYREIVRFQQLRKINTVLSNTDSYAINYFYDGQDGNNFNKGQIGNLHYQLSLDLHRLLRNHTQLVLIEPYYDYYGSVMVQLHEVPRFTGFREQLAYVQQYYESNFLVALPTMNEYIINKLLHNHYALKNSN
jgi:hypothetical protein